MNSDQTVLQKSIDIVIRFLFVLVIYVPVNNLTVILLLEISAQSNELFDNFQQTSI